MFVQAPMEFDDSMQGIFLAGGISGCPPWQDVMQNLLKDFPGVVYNPRRSVWPKDPAELERQIHWERRFLKACTLRLFWFPCETECPITLLELGHSIGANHPFVVGCHPDYSRIEDVKFQIAIDHPQIHLASSLTELAANVLSWFYDNRPVRKEDR